MVGWEDIATSIITGSGAVIALLVIMAIIVIGWLLYDKHIRRYQQFKCIIWQKDGFRQLTQKYDDAGIFVDKDTQKKRLFLKRARVGLSPDNTPFITGGKKKTIYLLQTGLKNFKYIKPVISDGHIKFSVGEEDVNWAIFDYEKQKKKFAQSWIVQYLPFIILAFVCLIILILFMYLFKQFSTIKDLIVELQTLAKIVAAAKSGTAVI